MTVIVPWRFLLVPWVDLQCVIVVLSDHATYFSVSSSLLVSLVKYTPFESPVYKERKQLSSWSVLFSIVLNFESPVYKGRKQLSSGYALVSIVLLFELQVYKGESSCHLGLCSSQYSHFGSPVYKR